MLFFFVVFVFIFIVFSFFFFQAEDGIRYLVRSRGLGDVYKRQHLRDDPRRARRHQAAVGALALLGQEVDDVGGQQHLSLIHI